MFCTRWLGLHPEPQTNITGYKNVHSARGNSPKCWEEDSHLREEMRKLSVDSVSPFGELMPCRPLDRHTETGISHPEVWRLTQLQRVRGQSREKEGGICGNQRVDEGPVPNQVLLLYQSIHASSNRTHHAMWDPPLSMRKIRVIETTHAHGTVELGGRESIGDKRIKKGCSLKWLKYRV